MIDLGAWRSEFLEVVLDHDKNGCVALYAARIRFFSQTLVDCHALGVPPGNDEEPWQSGFQEAAAASYRSTLPGAYLERLAGVFLGCSNTMRDISVPARIVDEWAIVRDYFVNSSSAICGEMGFEPEAAWEDPQDKEPTTPGVVRFDLLAGLVATSGATRMRDAGNSVADFFNEVSTPRLSDIQMDILYGISRGQRVVDLAHSVGCSQRTMYREMSEMWVELGVANRYQGVARAIQLGLISEIE